GVVYDPFLKRIYEGVAGGGSFCNGNRLAVSKEKLSGSTVAITSTAEKIRTAPYIKKLEEAGVRLASFSGGVYKSCLVARGKCSGYLESQLNAHDMAAIEIIITEAGGKVSSMTGEILDYTRPFKGAIVSNGVVHEELIKIINF
ncbi:MAG TPA: inositol monophosphatase family protein, partial [Candidatus Paceibacterota bacterium]|nr:inositol monophosphatase family protein [Candidatus Paceibacterota bacterium]